QRSSACCRRQHAKGDPQPMRSIEDTIQAYFKAFEAADVAAVVDVYADDAAIAPMGMDTIRGSAAIEAAYGAIFGMVSKQCLSLNFDRIEESGNLAFAETHGSETLTNRADNTSATYDGRSLFCLRKTGEDWHIVSYIFNHPPEG